MNKLQCFLNKHSTLILSAVASSGVIFTAILAVKATPKAIKMLDEAQKNKGSDLTNIEKIKIGIKPYGYTILSGISTIACIGGIEYLNRKKQVSLISAYTLLSNGYNEYKNNIKKLCPNNEDIIATRDIIQAKYVDSNINIKDNEELFFDYTTMRFFVSTLDAVTTAGNDTLDILKTQGYICVNEWYDMLGIPSVEWGYQLGWADFESNDPYNCKEMDFTYEQITVGDNIPCWVIMPTMPATFDYII